MESVLVVGGGCFGLSAALALVQGDYAEHENLITVIDRSDDPPSLDAASSDYNKIIRSDYSDKTWAQLAAKAIRAWNQPEWSPYFHQAGCLVTAHSAHTSSSYVRQSLTVNSDPSMAPDGRLAIPLADAAEIRKVLGKNDIGLGAFEGETAYLNPLSGWASAREATVALAKRLKSKGVQFRAGEVDRLLYAEKEGRRDVVGVILSDGKEIRAGKVVVAAGSWSGRIVPEITTDLIATGQGVAHIKLSAEEAEKYSHVPVVFRMDTGFYVFPPNKDRIMKFAIHGPGYINLVPTSDSSLPPAALPLDCYQKLPPDLRHQLEEGLGATYPDLAKKEWCETRLCWYSDSPSSDWLIDYHPTYPSLFLATGDSGHGFKFLPTLADMIGPIMRREPPAPGIPSFTWDKLKLVKGDLSRGGLASLARKVLADVDENLPLTSSLDAMSLAK